MTEDIIKIHPFDMYILIRDTPDLRPEEIIKRGTIPIEINNVPEPYVSNHPMLEIRGKLYCETTTVPAITKEIQ